ncbi:hypothetical protein EXIGLDRAFT_728364 [Exidia glandulosa HHB12029]|uniref:Uncharacterized protein n=1 Tax=Exidia glandulosa HHB12029 TaxID=1314781 RepID=A0A165LUR3_EXIGL|nr:hypothetical protein EXIGLDRAFT_728364 [Exidia glandulosa HHB12029]
MSSSDSPLVPLLRTDEKEDAPAQDGRCTLKPPEQTKWTKASIYGKIGICLTMFVTYSGPLALSRYLVAQADLWPTTWIGRLRLVFTILSLVSSIWAFFGFVALCEPWNEPQLRRRHDSRASPDATPPTSAAGIKNSSVAISLLALVAMWRYAGPSDHCRPDELSIFILGSRTTNAPSVAQIYEKHSHRDTLSLLRTSRDTFTLGLVHDERPRPISARYNVTCGVAILDDAEISARFDQVLGSMNVSLPRYGTIHLAAAGPVTLRPPRVTLHDNSNFGGGELVLRTVGHPWRDCGTLKVCAAPFTFEFLGKPRQLARALLPLGIVMYQQVLYAETC